MSKYPQSGSINTFVQQKVNHKKISPYGSKYQTSYSSNRMSKQNVKAQDKYQTDYEEVKQVFSFQNIPEKMLNLQKHLTSQQEKLKQNRQAKHQFFSSPKNSESTKDNYRDELMKQIQQNKERKKREKQEIQMKELEDQRKFYNQLMNEKQRQKKTRQMKRNQLQPAKKQQKLKSNQSYFMMRTIYKNRQNSKTQLDEFSLSPVNSHFQVQHLNEKIFLKNQGQIGLKNLSNTTQLRNNNFRRGSHFSIKKKQEIPQNLNNSLRHYKNKQSLQSSLIQNVEKSYEFIEHSTNQYNSKQNQRLKRLQDNQNKILSKLGLIKNQIIDKFNSTHHRLGEQVSRVKDALRSKSFFINKKQELDDSHYYIQPYESYEIPQIIQEKPSKVKSPLKQQQSPTKNTQQKKPKFSSKLRKLDQLYEKLKKKNQQITKQKEANTSKIIEQKAQQTQKSQTIIQSNVFSPKHQLEKEQIKDILFKQSKSKQLRDIGVGPDYQHEAFINEEQQQIGKISKISKISDIQTPIILNLKQKTKFISNSIQKVTNIHQEIKKQRQRETPTFQQKQIISSQPSIETISKRIYGKKVKQQNQQNIKAFQKSEMFVQGRSLIKPQSLQQQTILMQKQNSKKQQFGLDRKKQSYKKEQQKIENQEIIVQNYQQSKQQDKNNKQSLMQYLNQSYEEKPEDQDIHQFQQQQQKEKQKLQQQWIHKKGIKYQNQGKLQIGSKQSNQNKLIQIHKQQIKIENNNRGLIKLQQPFYDQESLNNLQNYQNQFTQRQNNSQKSNNQQQEKVSPKQKQNSKQDQDQQALMNINAPQTQLNFNNSEFKKQHISQRPNDIINLQEKSILNQSQQNNFSVIQTDSIIQHKISTPLQQETQIKIDINADIDGQNQYMDQQFSQNKQYQEEGFDQNQLDQNQQDQYNQYESQQNQIQQGEEKN